MRVSRALVVGFLAVLVSWMSPGDVLACIPFPPLSTCRVTVNQFPPRPACVSNFEPDVVRLCPSTSAPAFDTATFDLTIIDPSGFPFPNAVVSLYELSGVVNIATGGSTTAISDSDGKAVVSLTRGSGYGRVGVCADGILMCEIAVRSPDVASTGIASGCAALPTAGSSFVNSSDRLNTSCGFSVHFGPVTPGMNDAWDLNCDNLVNSSDTGGQFVPGFGIAGGLLQHFGHGDVLGAKTTCP